MARKYYDSWPQIPRIDPWGGMDSMLRLLNEMEDKEDRAQERRVTRLMNLYVAEEKQKDARVEKNVAALETAWSKEKSPANKSLLQASAKTLIRRQRRPDIANRLNRIAGGMVDLKLEAANNYLRDNPFEQHKENEPLAEQSRVAFKNQHIKDRYKHIRLTGGIAGTPLTNSLPLDEWENKETGRKVARFQTYSTHNGLPVYGTIDETDMNVIQAAKIYGGGDKGNSVREIAATGGVSFSRDGQIGMENVKFKTFIPAFGKNKGIPQTQIENLPRDLDAKRSFMANVLASHSVGAEMDPAKEEDVYREQAYVYYNKASSPAEKQQALIGMTARLPGHVPVMTEAGEKAGFLRTLTGISAGMVGIRPDAAGWVRGEKEEFKFMRGNFVDAMDSTGAKFRLIHNPETDTILDSTGKEFTMMYTDPDGNPKEYTFRTRGEAEAYLKVIPYKKVKSGKAEVPAPWSISYPTRGHLRTVAEYQGVEVAIGDRGGYYLRKPGGNWYTPKSEGDKILIEQARALEMFRSGGTQ